MSNRIQSVFQPYLDTNGEFQWPADEMERNRIASRLLGACIVGCMDYWMEDAFSILQAGFSADQHAKVKMLLFRTIGGVVFSILVKLDQFPMANLDLILKDLENQENIASIGDGDIFDFHDHLSNWLDEFSTFPDAYYGK